MKKKAEAPSSPILKGEDLWLAYDGKTFILQGAEIGVKSGVVSMMLGRSGSGKTTLLKVLAGLVRPQKGSVALHGSPSRTAGPRVAYVPQTLGLVRGMTALENTLVGALHRTGTLRSVFRWFPSAVVERAKATLAGMGLAAKWDEKVIRLSGGERQRVAIARALMQEPDFILADEFVSQLDPITTDEILQAMRKLARRGTGFLVTAHDLSIVEHYADEFFIMKAGKIAHGGPVASFNAEDVKRLLKIETTHS